MVVLALYIEVFGAPGLLADHADQALAAPLEIERAVQELPGELSWSARTPAGCGEVGGVARGTTPSTAKGKRMHVATYAPSRRRGAPGAGV